MNDVRELLDKSLTTEQVMAYSHISRRACKTIGIEESFQNYYKPAGCKELK